MALTDSLVSYWKMDEASGNALDAHGSMTLTETSGTIGTATGKLGGARDFERGDTEYFEHADHADLSVGNIDFTISCWVKHESSSVYNPIIFKQNENTGVAYSLIFDGDGDGLYHFAVSSGDGYVDWTEVATGPNGGGPPSNGVWYFLVAWHDSVANTINISVNDTDLVSVPYSAGSYDDGGPFYLGASPDVAGYFDGLIDEVGFWKRVLTSGERTQLYNGGAGLAYPFSPPPPPPPSTAGPFYYTMLAGSGGR